MWLEQQSENTHEPEIIPISTLENKTQTEKNDQIIEAWLQQQQIDLEKAAILSQEIKWEFNQSSSNQWVLNDNYEPEILIHDLRTFLEWKTPHEKYAILDAIVKLIRK